MPKLAQFRAKHDALPAAAAVSADALATPIVHLDMDAFFVSVELLDRPHLRGAAVVVGGPRDARGVVTSASYEARAFGVRSAMPLRTAAKLCPHAVFLENRHELYSRWSDRVAQILSQFSPIVEMASIDEAYLDLRGTERLFGPPLAAAHTLLSRITGSTGLPCSAGLAATRLVAKVASDSAKPRGLFWVPAGAEKSFLAPLSVRKIPGIGRVTESALNAMGIQTVGQLATRSREQLEESFGRWGEALYRKARGIDSYEFLVDAEPKSISHNHTFGEDTADSEKLLATLSHLGQKSAKRLRDAGLSAKTITVTIRYANFRTHTHAHTLSEPADIDHIILSVAKQLFEQHRDPAQKVRLVGVALSSFFHGNQQLALIDAGKMEKLERLARATDKLRERFGFSKLQYGGSLPHDEH